MMNVNHHLSVNGGGGTCLYLYCICMYIAYSANNSKERAQLHLIVSWSVQSEYSCSSSFISLNGLTVYLEVILPCDGSG